MSVYPAHAGMVELALMSSMVTRVHVKMDSLQATVEQVGNPID